MFKYLNINPKKRICSDCTVRAFALSHNISWYDAYDILSAYARKQCIVIDDTSFIDDFLSDNYNYICYKCKNQKITIQEISEKYAHGVYLITMNGHITCMIDGIIYDIWDPSEKYAWRVWKVAD